MLWLISFFTAPHGAFVAQFKEISALSYFLKRRAQFLCVYFEMSYALEYYVQIFRCLCNEPGVRVMSGLE